jgi:hypothetical protein
MWSPVSRAFIYSPFIAPARHHIYYNTAPPRSTGYALDADVQPPLVRAPLAINTKIKKEKKTCFLTRHPIHRCVGGVMSGAGTEGKKPRLAEHEDEHIVSIMEMVRV